MPRGHRGSLATFLKFALLVLALVAASVSFAAERIVSSRVWPAQEYTRVTLESATRPSLQDRTNGLTKESLMTLAATQAVRINDSRKEGQCHAH